MAHTSFLLAPLLVAAAAAAAAPPAPPCYNPLNPDFETLCYSTTQTSGNVTIRVIGAGVDGVLATGMSAFTNFSAGSQASAVPLFEYFLSDNESFQKIPLTAPLIFRPDPAGTWLASFALPTSKIPAAASAPGILPGTDLRLEEFAAPAPGVGRTVAAYPFYTINVAQQADYEAACAALSAALPALGLAPVAGAWREAWVAWSAKAMVGDMANECWIEVSTSSST